MLDARSRAPAATLVATSSSNPRALPAEELADLARAATSQRSKRSPIRAAALARARDARATARSS